MANFSRQVACYCFALVFVFFASCKDDVFNTINQDRAAPQITLSAESGTIEAYEGLTASATVAFEAQAGIASVEVIRDGQLIDTIEGASGRVRIEHRVQHVVPESAIVGSNIVYTFVLQDRLDRQTEQSLTISIVESPPVPEFEFEDVSLGGHDYRLINLDINRDVTLSNDHDYLLRGTVSVIQDATMNIEEGTTIYAESGASLVVTTGARLVAEGTSAMPIRFTSLLERSGSSNQGDWVGIFLHGLAPVATVNDVIVDNVGSYGGSQEDDDSGSLTYVEISYAGALAISGEGQELNAALNLNGIGSGTHLEHIAVREAGLSRTAVLASGGSARIKYLFVSNPNGRAFVWKDGYSGFVQFLVAVYTSNPSNAFTALDGFGDTSMPIFSNVSIQGGGFSNTRGVRFRSPSKGRIYNSWVNGTGNPGLRTDATTDVLFANGRIWGNTNNFHNNASSYNSAGAPYFNSSDAVTITDEYKEVATDNAVDPTTLDSWFSEAAYIGAVNPANDWTTWLN